MSWTTKNLPWQWKGGRIPLRRIPLSTVQAVSLITRLHIHRQFFTTGSTVCIEGLSSLEVHKFHRPLFLRYPVCLWSIYWLVGKFRNCSGGVKVVTSTMPSTLLRWLTVAKTVLTGKPSAMYQPLKCQTSRAPEAKQSQGWSSQVLFSSQEVHGLHSILQRWFHYGHVLLYKDQAKSYSAGPSGSLHYHHCKTDCRTT